MNWIQAINDYNFYLKIERGLAQNTIDNYVNDITKLANYLDKYQIVESPINITETTIKQFIYDIAKVVKTRSQARIISGLRSFFDYLIFEEYREDNPTELIELPKISKTLPDSLSVEEINSLIQAIDLSHPQGERNKTIIETIYACGLRVSELINLKLSDLFFDDGYIRILGKGNKYRFVPIHHTTVKLLNSYLQHIRKHINPKENCEDFVFLSYRGGQLSRQMIFIILKKLASKINLQKKIGPHTLRHSFATHLLKNGADLRVIQQLLGHESITTTEIYVHLDNTYLKEVVSTYHPMNKTT